MPLPASEMAWIDEMVNESIAKEEAAKGINQKADCDKCKTKVIHRTCKGCKKVRCKDCVKHWPCPGCEEWFCQDECLENRVDNLFWCNKHGMVCESCLPFLFDKFTLMEACAGCTYCEHEIPKKVAEIKKRYKEEGKDLGYD
jgi:hypothetical protein